MEKELLGAKEIFDFLKENKELVEYEELRKNKKNLLAEAEKALKSGQKLLAQHILVSLEAISKEMVAVDAGLDQVIDKELLFEYVNKSKDRTVVINYLEEFPRTIPDEVVAKIENARNLNIFDRFLIIFTDYTGSVREKVEKTRREKDPIVVGIFCDKDLSFIYDRFYFIADWIDEYCDLTLEQLIKEQRDINPEQKIVKNIHEENERLSKEQEELYEKNIMEELEKAQENVSLEVESKKSFLQRLKYLFTGKL